MIRLALFISGSGSTAAFIINSCRKKKLKIDPVLVVASKKEISGIQRIKDLGFPNKNIKIADPRDFDNPPEFGEKLRLLCLEFKIDYIGQYGWLPKTPKKLIEEFPERIINQHPGPLDESGVDFGGVGMYGRRVHASVLYFRRLSGHDYWTEATSHLVTPEFDRGDVLGRIKVNISQTDTVESLQMKMLPVEHNLQFQVLQKIADGRIKKLKRKTRLIRQKEYGLLNKAKEIAAVFYPRG